MRQKHHVEPPTEEKQKKQNQDCLLHNPEKVDSFHKKLDEILHPVIEEFGITMQSSTSETWSSPPITDISLGDELNIQLESPPAKDAPYSTVGKVQSYRSTRHTASLIGNKTQVITALILS